jgi:hypothetical protein
MAREAGCGPSFEAKKVAQAISVSRLRTDLFGPKPTQRMCSASDIEYADLHESTPYSHLTLKYIGQFHARFLLYISSLAVI